MKQTLRFLLRLFRPSVITIPLLVLGVMVCSLLLPQSSIVGRFITSFLLQFPIVHLVFLSILCYNFFSYVLQLTLSFSITRRSYFWAANLLILILLAVCWLDLAAVDAFIAFRHIEDLPIYYQQPPSQVPAFLLLLAVTSLAGGISGYGATATSHRILCSVLHILSISVSGIFAAFLFHPSDLWGDLPLVLTVILWVLLPVEELILWRMLQRATVR